jgi:hypothetical protein
VKDTDTADTAQQWFVAVRLRARRLHCAGAAAAAPMVTLGCSMVWLLPACVAQPCPGRQLLSRHPCRVICVVWCLGRAMSLGCLSCPLCFIGVWSLAPSSLSVAVCYESAQQRCVAVLGAVWRYYCHIVAVTVRPDAALCEQQAACGVASSQAACECVVCSTLRCQLLQSLRCCVWVLSGIGKQSRVCRRSAQHFSSRRAEEDQLNPIYFI